jgi:Dehydrogenases with different specificities (related to short-chain alcohol dehydrogenases)|tara:strand:- start:731 stop:1432 length:702 start_codon:yes stop_codon:yes gene_type:complete
LEHELSKSISLVTGASSGIGAQTAIELSKVSSHIYIIGRNIKNLEIINDKIISNNCECTIVPLDITEGQALNNLAKTIAEKNDKIDIIVSCAGVIDQLSPVDSINEIEFKNIVETNYIANFILIKSFHYLLKNSKNGRLVILSTNQNDDGQYWGVYRPIMKALNALVITYANENKKTKIKANILCPSSVNTSFRDKIMPGEDKKTLLSPFMVAQKILELTSQDYRLTGKIINI